MACAFEADGAGGGAGGGGGRGGVGSQAIGMKLHATHKTGLVAALFDTRNGSGTVMDPKGRCVLSVSSSAQGSGSAGSAATAATAAGGDGGGVRQVAKFLDPKGNVALEMSRGDSATGSDAAAASAASAAGVALEWAFDGLLISFRPGTWELVVRVDNGRATLEFSSLHGGKVLEDLEASVAAAAAAAAAKRRAHQTLSPTLKRLDILYALVIFSASCGLMRLRSMAGETSAGAAVIAAPGAISGAATVSSAASSAAFSADLVAISTAAAVSPVVRAASRTCHACSSPSERSTTRDSVRARWLRTVLARSTALAAPPIFRASKPMVRSRVAASFASADDGNGAPRRGSPLSSSRHAFLAARRSRTQS